MVMIPCVIIWHYMRFSITICTTKPIPTRARQTLNYPSPEIAKAGYQLLNVGGLTGDADIPAGRFMLSATQQDGFVFDNEKWAHPVEINPFNIAKAAVSNAGFLKFVEAGGYENPQL